MNTYTDNKGRTWHKFSVAYTHELDDQAFSFDIWVIDHAGAFKRLEFIKSNGKIEGMIIDHE